MAFKNFSSQHIIQVKLYAQEIKLQMGQMIKSDTEERKVEKHYDRYFNEGPNWPSAFWEWVRGRRGQGR